MNIKLNYINDVYNFYFHQRLCVEPNFKEIHRSVVHLLLT